MKSFLELTLHPQRDSFGEKRRHFDLVATSQISLTTEQLAHPFTGRFVHRQTKQNPYNRAQTLVLQIDTAYYYPRGIPYSTLQPKVSLQLRDKPKGPPIATADILRRWWEPAVRQDFPKLASPSVNDQVSLIIDPLVFAPHELKWLFLGKTPTSQDDRWLIYGQRPWLYIHRSWSGLPLFALRFEQATLREAFTFAESIKKGVDPQSMAGTLQNLLGRIQQQANHVLDTAEAQTFRF